MTKLGQKLQKDTLTSFVRYTITHRPIRGSDQFWTDVHHQHKFWVQNADISLSQKVSQW